MPRFRKLRCARILCYIIMHASCGASLPRWRGWTARPRQDGCRDPRKDHFEVAAPRLEWILYVIVCPSCVHRPAKSHRSVHCTGYTGACVQTSRIKYLCVFKGLQTARHRRTWKVGPLRDVAFFGNMDEPQDVVPERPGEPDGKAMPWSSDKKEEPLRGMPVLIKVSGRGARKWGLQGEFAGSVVRPAHAAPLSSGAERELPRQKQSK